MKKAEDWIKDKYCNPIWTEWQSGDVLDAIEEYSIEAFTEDRQQIKDMIDAEIELYRGIIKSTEDKPTKMAFEGSVLALNKIRSKL